MPTYEYECKKCGYRFELFQKITEPTVANCPKCSQQAQRVISSGAGLIFKGKGFYITDYKRKDAQKEVSPSCPKSKDGCNACQG